MSTSSTEMSISTPPRPMTPPPVSPTPCNSPARVEFFDDAGVTNLPVVSEEDSDKKFTMFPDLVVELQNQIFKACTLSQPRVIQVYEEVRPKNMPAGGGTFESTMKVYGAERPNILKASKAALQCVLGDGTYRLLFKTGGAPFGVYFNPKIDSVRINSDGIFSNIGPMRVFPESLTNKFEADFITTIEIPLYALERTHPKWIADNINKLPNLKHINITARDLVDGVRTPVDGMFFLSLEFKPVFYFAPAPEGERHQLVSEIVPSYKGHLDAFAMFEVRKEVRCTAQQQRLMNLLRTLNKIDTLCRKLPQITLRAFYAPGQTVSASNFPSVHPQLFSMGLGN